MKKHELYLRTKKNTSMLVCSFFRIWLKFTKIYSWKSRTQFTTEVPRTFTRSSSHSKRGTSHTSHSAPFAGQVMHSGSVTMCSPTSAPEPPLQVVDLWEILQPRGDSHQRSG